MGRFDALTELENNQQPTQQPSVQPSAVPSPVGATPQPPGEKKQSATTSKRQPPKQPGKSMNALQPKLDKFDKYSTYLRPGYKKELKLLAAELDRKDYELIDEALTLYFANHKK